MVLVALRCPSCSAPVHAAAGEVALDCAYCGVSLQSAAARTRTVYVVMIERIGPSNRTRVAEVLRSLAKVVDADRVVASAPGEAAVIEDSMRAEELLMALVEAGALARIEHREIVVEPPVVLPERAVILESVGANKVSVMKVVRAHVDLGVAEAKRLVDRAPCVLVEALEGARAAALVAALIAAGADARLR